MSTKGQPFFDVQNLKETADLRLGNIDEILIKDYLCRVCEKIFEMETLTRTKVKALLKEEPGKEVLAKGWVRTKRGNKNVAFIALNDGSTINNIQIVVDVANFGDEILKKITTGACIGVTGDLVASMGSGQAVEIQAKEITVFGEADPNTYPLQKKGHSLE